MDWNQHYNNGLTLTNLEETTGFLFDTILDDIHIHVEQEQQEQQQQQEQQEEDLPNWNTPNTTTQVLGADILATFPNCMHFVSGVAFFDTHPSNPSQRVADNQVFREIIKSYFEMNLLEKTFQQSLQDRNGKIVYRVVKHVLAILEKARMTPLPRIGGKCPIQVCIWKRTEQEHLSESNWKTVMFREISQDSHQVKTVLQSPLKTSLQKLFPFQTHHPAETAMVDQDNMTDIVQQDTGRIQSSTSGVVSMGPSPCKWEVNFMPWPQWWDRVPPTNIPYLQAHQVREPEGIRNILNLPGRAVALVDLTHHDVPTHANMTANHFARRWESEGERRFALWLDASSEDRLRKDLLSAIHQITFSTLVPSDPLDKSTKVLASALLTALNKRKELTDRQLQGLVVFANLPHQATFHTAFFSAEASWWNAPARYMITTTSPTVHVQVQVQENTDNVSKLVKIPSIECFQGSEEGSNSIMQEQEQHNDIMVVY